MRKEKRERLAYSESLDPKLVTPVLSLEDKSYQATNQMTNQMTIQPTKQMLLMYLKVKSQPVDGDGVFASVVLHDTCQKGLCEEEAGHPEQVWLVAVVPIL